MTSCTPAREYTGVGEPRRLEAFRTGGGHGEEEDEEEEEEEEKEEEESMDVRLLYFAPLRLIYGLPCRFIEGCRLRNERHWYTSPRTRLLPPPPPRPPFDLATGR